jgi:hypothetical protein
VFSQKNLEEELGAAKGVDVSALEEVDRIRVMLLGRVLREAALLVDQVRLTASSRVEPRQSWVWPCLGPIVASDAPSGLVLAYKTCVTSGEG